MNNENATNHESFDNIDGGTVKVKKVCDFDARPDLDEPRQHFSALENLIVNHHDTTNTGNRYGSFLIANTALLKRGNLNAMKFEESQTEDEGNRILETRVSVHPNVLTMYINLSEIGIIEGRGSFEVRPEENGFWLQAQELECYKNSGNEEAHAVKRSILRNYTVNGKFDWKNLMSTLMPDGTLYIAVNALCHPGPLSFPVLAQETTYSSLAGRRPDFPHSNQTHTFGTFANINDRIFHTCGNCGKNKSVAAQTGSSLACLPIIPDFGSNSSETQTLGSEVSWAQTQTCSDPCICDSDSMMIN